MRLIVSAASRVWSVLKDDVSSLRRGEGYPGALGAPDLADHDNVRVLPENAPQDLRVSGRVRSHFALVDDALVVVMEELYGVLCSDDMLRRRAVY